jgi:hypothetical protein
LASETDIATHRPEHVDASRCQSLCKALSNAHDDDRELDFFVQEAAEATGPGEIPVYTPKVPTPGRRLGDSPKFPADSFWTLVKGDYFARTPTMELQLRAGSNAAVFGMDQRKALAVKLVLGLMLSMDSDLIIGTWNPKRVQSFKPYSRKVTVFVSIQENKDTSGPKGLPLAQWGISRDRGTDDDDLQPLPPFTLLAKMFLQIARGERLRSLKLACHSDRAFRAGWKMHRRLVEDYIRMVTSGDGVDREVLPFLRAAQNCLDFHMLYQKQARISPSSPRMEIAWKLVFTDILSQIDSSLTLGGLVQPGMNDLINGPFPPAESQTVVEESSTAQHEVALFDGEDVMEST